MSTDHYCCDALVHPHWGVPAPVTPREVLVGAYLAEWRHNEAAADRALTVLSAAGFEVLPTALVDAVLDTWPVTKAQRAANIAARRALAAYRAPVQGEEE